MAPTEEECYDGSRILEWVTGLTGVAIDQVNFVASQLLALGFAVILKTYFHPSKTSAKFRHLYSCIVGLSLAYFSHGSHVLHIIALPCLSYIVMRFTSPKILQKVILVFALVYLSVVHLKRQIYNYGSYVLDITGPMMVITQKVTSLAFSVHDGMSRNESSLNNTQRKRSLRKLPSIIEYFGYMFQFQTLMCGPLLFYSDYIDFIEGKHLIPVTGTNGVANGQGDHIHQQIGEAGGRGDFLPREPSPFNAVIKKLSISIGCAFVLLYFTSVFPIERISEESFMTTNTLAYKMFFIIMALNVVRLKYYHAWLLAEAVCNASGLGFNGYDINGNAKWDLLSNVDILKFEFGLSLRECLENWNRTTLLWLRYVAYERTPFQKTLATYALSALWHGFYPGYYLTFFSGALFTVASRTVRKTVREFFQTSPAMICLYDLITMVFTKLLIGYITFPFVLLEFTVSIKLYRHLYFLLHILGVFAICVLPYLIPKKSKGKAVATEDSPVSKGVSDGLHVSNGGKVLAKVQ